jgi:predicted CXXCH cytochrome family protein
MRIAAKHVAAASVVTVLLVALLASACATIDRTVSAPPHVPGATFVGNQACADCHAPQTRLFSASAHGRFHKDDVNFAARTGCESCHGPGSLHVQAGGGRGKFIVNPGKDATTCFNCHLQQHAEFNLPQHHPVIENRMNCVSCHDPHGAEIFKPSPRGAATLAMARLNEQCSGCHREQARPFVWEHEALREGCVVCHQPHGSINRALLTERDNNLCLKCHSQLQANVGEIVIGKVDHTTFVARGTCWASGCHNAVHGSNVSPQLRY